MLYPIPELKEEVMKKYLVLFILLFGLCSMVYPVSPDRMISDLDGTALDITSGGGIHQAGGSLLSGFCTAAVVGTAQNLGSADIISITIRADDSNDGMLYIGTSGVTSSNGYQLSTGVVVQFEVDSLADIYFDADYSNDGLSYLAVVE